MSGETNPYKGLIVKQCRENRANDDTNGAMVNSKQHFELHAT